MASCQEHGLSENSGAKILPWKPRDEPAAGDVREVVIWCGLSDAVSAPPGPITFAAETLPAREALAASRTLRGTGAASVATVGAAGVEAAQEVLSEAQSVVVPLVPYLDSVRWLFIAIALAGIAG